MRQSCEADRSVCFLRQTRNALSMCGAFPQHPELQAVAAAVRELVQGWDDGVDSMTLLSRLSDIQEEAGDWPC